MAETRDNSFDVKALQKTRVETTYEYRSVLGGILGWWRKIHEMKVGEDFVIHVAAPLREMDRLYLNGFEIPIPDAIRKQLRARLVKARIRVEDRFNSRDVHLGKEVE
jgi:hypothetical protein